MVSNRGRDSPTGALSDESLASRGMRSPEAEYRALATELERRVAGDVRFDEYAQLLYATDGSIYQAEPAGVVVPKDVADVRTAVEVAAEHDVPILPRGAGSSLAGQAVGPGCVVLDFSKYMDGIVEIHEDERQVTVQPGVVLDTLDDELEEYGLKFAPDPASSNRATVGGAIGNNSTGAHSVRYGITDAYTEELRVILSDGSEFHTRDVVLDSPEFERIVDTDDREAHIYQTVRALVEGNEDEIERRYPDLKRSVSGYNLQKVIEERDGDRVINLSKLFVGAEGTLGVVVEATVSLVTKPAATAVAVYFFDELTAALLAVPVVLNYPVSAVELLDEEVFRLARESEGYAEFAEPIPDETAAALMVEWDNELVTAEGEALPPEGEYESSTVDYRGSGDYRERFEAAIGAVTEAVVEDGRAFDHLEAYSSSSQERLWKLRKAAIPLLMSLEGDPKPYPFIEDATVPPDELAAYVEQFETILDDHDTTAAYFAHAGSGTLHIRPVLNLKEETGVETMRSITESVTDLVLEYSGAFSGEHGDGMARTAYNPKMYGDELWEAFKRLKTTFDEEWLLHPGNVVYRDGPDDTGPDSERGVGADMRTNLRYGPGYRSLEPTTTLDFAAEGGFSHLVELCNGCGTCRQTGSDVMCPTYRASREEIQTTRGRANLLRAAINGDLDESELTSDRFHEEVLDLCIGCKGCKSDCPTGVDLAKLKAEVKHATHEEMGSSRRARFFADIDRYSGLGSRLAPVSNLLPKVPGTRTVMKHALGIAPERTLPTFTRETLCDWFDSREGAQVSRDEATDHVILFPDTFTNYSEPGPGKAAVSLLEAANVHVEIGESLAPSGRASYSLGFLEDARTAAKKNVGQLAPLVEGGWSVLFVEPSDAVMFQDEYLDLLDGTSVESVSSAAFGVSEYLVRKQVINSLSFEGADRWLTYHGHCHQHAVNRDHFDAIALEKAGYDVDVLDSGCCGMAGSFGYEAEHYELSKAIGQILYRQVDDSPGEVVTAPGASCRSQLADRPGESSPPHPIELLDATLA